MPMPRRTDIPPPNPSGLCMCGCGQKTKIAKASDPIWGHAIGHPVKYIRGHKRKGSRENYAVEDCGHDTPCWIWQGADSGRGYRRYHEGATTKPAHRAIYEKRNGPIPDGLHLDHLCRVPACVNPEHLEPVTGQVNTQRGEAAKLSPDDVKEIRRIRDSSGISYARIAEAMGLSVTRETIRRAYLGEHWGNVA